MEMFSVENRYFKEDSFEYNKDRLKEQFNESEKETESDTEENASSNSKSCQNCSALKNISIDQQAKLRVLEELVDVVQHENAILKLRLRVKTKSDDTLLGSISGINDSASESDFLSHGDVVKIKELWKPRHKPLTELNMLEKFLLRAHVTLNF
ncbi:hypothetical protein SteCoe_277 [Stentor coeruleus]|uniref:Uncharacterized protein n=1 Tax=Stentor coeruleus TaxID=5963 RepID=A0A1R2D4B6_9CILI|nr:hypothetical protein SteCoe_277 [Stentor coeruleus]